MDRLEEWKDIEGTNYAISTFGNLKNKQTNNILKTTKSSRGYLTYTSRTDNAKIVFFRIHREVAKAFIPNPNNLPQVNHIDGNKLNNCVDNLEWCDNSYNQLHANRIGLCKNRLEKSIQASSKPVVSIDKNGNVLKTYSSAREAEKDTGIGFKTISYMCIHKVKKSSKYNIIFRFASEVVYK